MPLFTQQPYYTVPSNDFGNFGSLVRFIDDWDKHFSQQHDRKGQSQARQPRRNLQVFTPRFDVKETEENYELHGELPGVEKKNINIEFSDLQTIVISGSVERTYTAGTPPAGLLGDGTAMSGAIAADDAHSDDGAETRSNKSFQATVEDEKAEGAEAGAAVAQSSKPDDNDNKVEPQQQQQPKHKYWVQERSVGSFSRTFAFSSRVDHDKVSASLENGILTVVVPKSKKPETRRIAIF